LGGIPGESENETGGEGKKKTRGDRGGKKGRSNKRWVGGGKTEKKKKKKKKAWGCGGCCEKGGGGYGRKNFNGGGKGERWS